MGLPLQPGLPQQPAVRRWLSLAVAAFAVLQLGYCGARQTPPPLLIATGADYASTVERLIAGAKQRITIHLFVCRVDDDGPVMGLITALGDARKRGVLVQVVLDAGTDRVTGERDSKNDEAAQRLATLGITVTWDDPKRTGHAKVVVIDGHLVVLGSHNWTRAALSTNREYALACDDPQLALAIEADLGDILPARP